MGDETDRHSRPDPRPAKPEPTPEERARLEAENGFRQFDRLMELVEEHLGHYFELKPSMLMELNRLAVEGLVADPGAYRQVSMTIEKSKHQPPKWKDVPRLIDEMCDYVNRNWSMPAVHLAAYLLWRLNWVHPFYDGNGALTAQRATKPAISRGAASMSVSAAAPRPEAQRPQRRMLHRGRTRPSPPTHQQLLQIDSPSS